MSRPAKSTFLPLPHGPARLLAILLAAVLAVFALQERASAAPLVGKFLELAAPGDLVPGADAYGPVRDDVAVVPALKNGETWAAPRWAIGAKAAGTRIEIHPGALAGVDALSAARSIGLDRVEHRIVKPPRAWVGTPAETLCDLSGLTESTVFFTASAAETANAFPKIAISASPVWVATIPRCTKSVICSST